MVMGNSATSRERGLLINMRLLSEGKQKSVFTSSLRETKFNERLQINEGVLSQNCDVLIKSRISTVQSSLVYLVTAYIFS
jgi:hypothetical protein